MPRKQKPDISKLVFFTSVAVLVCGLAFGFGLYSGVKRNADFHPVRNVWRDVKLVQDEVGNLEPDGDPIHFLQPSRKPGTGVAINERADDGNFVLYKFSNYQTVGVSDS